MINKDFNLEEKDVYKLFNDIKLEESEFDEMKEEISSIQKERIKKSLNKKIKGQKNFKILRYGSIAAAIGLVSIIGIGTASPAFAQNIPILSSITQTLNDKFGFYGDYAEYSQIINKGVTDNGVTLTINEVLADDSKLIIGYTIKSDKKIEDLQVAGLSRFLKINGKMYGSNGSSTGDYVDDYTYVGTEEIHTKIPQSSQTFKIDLDVYDIGGVQGKWNIAFSASKDELVKKSEIFKPNIKIDLPDSNATIDKVVFSPIDTSIFISGNGKNANTKGPNDMFGYDYWIAFDDKGVELIPKGLGGGTFDTNKNIFSSEMEYVKTKGIPKYLTIVPCKIIPSAGGGVSTDKDGKETPITIETRKSKEISKVIDGVYPIELSQGNMGKLIIKEIKTENNRTTVKYATEGKAPYFQAQDVLIKDDQGKNIIIKDYVKRNDSEKPNEFTKVFEALDPNRKYTIYTNDFSNVEFREDLKFRINLNK